MQTQHSRVCLCVCITSTLFGLVWPVLAWSQAATAQSRIVQPVDEAALVTLRGNTHPLAQLQFDRGAAPPDLPMARMLLVLKRSETQEASLEKLLDDQQDQSSPNYHQWLTPDQFGQQFGPSDPDIQAVTAWLRSNGFQIGQVGRGRTVIEFSGTAAQVQQAFRSEIHKFTVNGEDHWANASDPQIPAALSPVVAGVASLHNFPKRPLHRIMGRSSKNEAAGRLSPLGSEFTSGCSGLTCYFVGPYDFAKIYNVLPLWNATPAIDGTGQSIAIADTSNINIQDVRDFRNLFFPTLPTNDPQIFLDGPDPGLVPGAETEALLDVEWAAAVAKGATIKLVVSAPTNSTEGADLAALYAIENNLAPVVSESFGNCELFLGTAGNSFENLIRQQASAQGITFITASGDQGSATCDGSGAPPAPATFGLEVSGLASSPYGVAVGGTDFLNFGPMYQVNSPSPYWNPTNDATQASAIGYVPETTWNDSCTNNLFVFLGLGATPEASCNNSLLASSAVLVEGGGGGKSSCVSPTGATPASCAGHYAKPSWQSAPGVPADGARDVPDVSLFASVGFMGSGYILCESDLLPAPQTCSLNTAFSTFLGIGGTSASAPAFAGIMALVNQFTGASGQGNANYVLYKLASLPAQTSQNCGATSNPSSACIFYDVTSGTIAVPCAKGSTPDCTTSNPADTYGVLNGYNAGPGYDLATGLGSVNANNLVHNWAGPKTPSTTTLTLTPPSGGSLNSITHGQNVSVNIGVTPAAATGAVLLVGLPGGPGTTSVPMASFPLQQSGTASGTAILAGGQSYQVHAHYSGDGTYTPSDSAPVTVTVAKEASTTLITIPVFDLTTGNETGNTPTSITYGTPVAVRVDVGNASAKTTFPEQLVCAPLTCPTGNVTLSDAFNGGTPTFLSSSGGFPLSSGGYALDFNVPLFPGGGYQFAASYLGDNSYLSSLKTYNLTVTPAVTQMQSPAAPSPAIAGTQVSIGANVAAASPFPGVAPTGTISFYDGTTLLSSTAAVGSPGSLTTASNASGMITTTFTASGTHPITAKYSGDTNYGPASSSPTGVSVVYATSGVVTANPTTVNLGQSVNVTATITGASKTPTMTGTIQFPGVANPVAGMASTDASGNQTLTATAMVKPQFSGLLQVNYSGDSNYESANAGANVTVNQPDFAIGAGSSNIPIPAGQTGTTQITITPLNNISDSVALNCNTQQMANVTCSFNPPSPLSVSNMNAASTMLSIGTLAPSSSPSTSFIGTDRQRWEGIWPPGSWMFALADGLAISLFSLSLGRKKRHLAGALGMGSLLFLVLSCGSGGGGGGGGGPVPTTLTLTTSSVKAPSATNFTLTATVHSANPVTGVVYFIDNTLNTDIQGVLINGVATVQLAEVLVGTHMMSAQYPGDANNQASQTKGSINQVITGTGQLFVNATGAAFSHSSTMSVTIQ